MFAAGAASSTHAISLYAGLLLLASAALLAGQVAQRWRVPGVVGEIVGGVLLGPTVLGSLLPGWYDDVVPAAGTPSVEVVAWLGALLLVLGAGVETDPSRLRSEGRTTLVTYVCGFVVPFASGFLLAQAMPASLLAPNVSRTTFALFLGTAMSISAVPVITRIFADLGLVGSRVWNVVVGAAVAEDATGWMVLAAVGAYARGSGSAGNELAVVAGELVLFVALAATAGRRFARFLLRRAGRSGSSHGQLAAVLLIALAFGGVSDAIGTHMAFGAFVAGIVVRSTGELRENALDGANAMGRAFFYPVFFAYAGLRTDLTSLRAGTAGIALVLLAVAFAGKLAGAGLGSWVAGLPGREALAVGGSLNARGAMELVIASTGLSLGLISVPVYGMLVLLAIVSSLAAPPIIRLALRAEVRSPAWLPVVVRTADAET